MEEDLSLEHTKLRLGELEHEIQDLKSKRDLLKARWELEKKYIVEIQNLKAEIENLKHQSEDYERQGLLAKVAEIRYGTIMELEKQLAAAHEKLKEIQSTGKLLKEEVDAEDIAEIVSKWTGIPVMKMLETERTKLIYMEDRLHKRIVGQDHAITAISNAIRRTRAGLQDKNKPIGSFIFIGSTGVGKTEMARALAEFLFDDEAAIVRIDMSEYMEKFSVSRLIGAPPGYVGYEEGGQLTEAVRRKPYSVVLLDEIEKANNEVFNVLLQVLDEGRLTDSKSRTVNFKNTIIIMTSNLGTELIQDKYTDMDDSNRDDVFNEIRMKITESLRKRLRPEFLNRIDEIIMFKPLTQSEINQITVLQLDILKKKLEELGIKLDISDEAIEWLGKLGFDPNYGARPLKRVIQKHISDPLSLLLLESRFISGDIIKIITNDKGNFIFNKI